MATLELSTKELGEIKIALEIMIASKYENPILLDSIIEFQELYNKIKMQYATSLVKV